MTKKLDKMEISQHEKRNVMEAKLKKLIKSNETAFTKSKEKSEKNIEKLGEGINKFASKI